MRKKLSIIVALAAAAVIAATTVSSAFASPTSVPLDCGAAQTATGISGLNIRLQRSGGDRKHAVERLLQSVCSRRSVTW